MYDRVIKLIGEDNLKILNNTKILLVGVGGVGSFTYEALIRTGFMNITIIDKDKVDITNLNRQLIANLDTINTPKVISAYNKAMNINPNINIKPLEMNLDQNNINTLDKDYDYIIDACDDINAKIELYKFASLNNIKIISSMGVGNRVDASKLEVMKLNKTMNDPLAKKIRKLVKDNHLNDKIPVVCSTEIPQKKGSVTSIVTLPGTAGLLIVNYIINDLIFINKERN